MSDDKSKRGRKTAAALNLNQDCEIRYWSEKFGVTEERLREHCREWLRKFKLRLSVGLSASGRIRRIRPRISRRGTGSK